MASIAAEASLRLARYKRRAHLASLAHRLPGQPLPGQPIASWREFYAATAQRPWLAELDRYPDALFIAGCDWSAATAVTRLFKRLPSFADTSWSHDDELDGALLLAGWRDSPDATSRHCFQTSYLQNRFDEYFTHEGFRLVWIVREPRAAVGSLLARQKTLPAGTRLNVTAAEGASRLEKACATYVATVRRTLELRERLGDRVAIVDYDKLAAERARLLPALCSFAGASFDIHLLRHLHGKSVRKGSLASWESLVIDELTLPAYRRARAAANLGAHHG